jgi:hypothetical protein
VGGERRPAGVAVGRPVEQEEMVAALAADRDLCEEWATVGQAWVQTWHDPGKAQRDMLAVLQAARDGRLG